MLTLRPYQAEAIDAIYAYWRVEPGNPLIVMPTGSGKSLVMAALMQDLLAKWPDMRIACVTHVKELIAQNYSELVTLWPWAPAGIYSAGLGRRETQTQILFCGIQSVYDKAQRIGHVDALIVDEAHLIPRKSATSYGKFIVDLRAINSDLKIVGLTATPYRLDSGRLDEADPKTKAPAMFDRVACEISIRDLIPQYLCPLITKATATVLSVEGVHRRGGEFIAGELEDAVNKPDIVAQAVDEIIRYGHDRKCWIAYCAGVDHAYAVRDEFRRRAITCETVTGGTPKAERDQLVAGFRAGRFRCLTNVNVLAIGFNVPQIDLLAMLRPTESTGLYVQQAGRASRNAPGKRNALILDFAGNIARHGPVDDVHPRKPGEGTGPAPIKICPECATIVPAGSMECPDCGYEFPRDLEPPHDGEATSAPILASAAPEWLPVARRTLQRHDKAGGTASVRVDYLCGLAVQRQWICPEHSGFARAKFETWWRDHGGAFPAPLTVDDALARQGELRPTEAIRIVPDGKYFKVVGYKAVAVVPGRAAA